MNVYIYIYIYIQVCFITTHGAASSALYTHYTCANLSNVTDAFVCITREELQCTTHVHIQVSMSEGNNQASPIHWLCTHTLYLYHPPQIPLAYLAILMFPSVFLLHAYMYSNIHDIVAVPTDLHAIRF